MERAEAIRRLRQIEGQDLVKLAKSYPDVTIWKNGKLNKGWAGHTIERYLGLPRNSAQAPNFGSWELKQVSLKTLKSGQITVKETMAITMIDPIHVAETTFENSHLLAKLRKAVVCARLFESKDEFRTILVKVCTFDLDNIKIYNQVKEDYELVRNTINVDGFEALTGKMGILVQPRTKGAGHGSKSRAFYARTGFVKTILGMQE